MIKVITATCVLMLLFVTSAISEERVDFFDLRGNRTDYAIVDRETGRVDFYDVKSRRVGWGRVDSTGMVERFGPDSRGQEDTPLPLPPRPPEP